MPSEEPPLPEKQARSAIGDVSTSGEVLASAPSSDAVAIFELAGLALIAAERDATKAGHVESARIIARATQARKLLLRLG